MSEKESKNISKKNDAYARHKQLMQEYLKRKTQPKPSTYIPSVYKTERDIIRENHKFVRSEDDEETTWEQRVAKKYYDKLFKEYAICELKYYKEGRIALRWRTEKEVVIGKGQFICGSTRCESITNLKSWEVNFGYIEDGEKKNELVKVRLCEDCSDKLNYKTKKRLAKTLKRKREEEQDRKKRSKKSKSSAHESDTDESKNRDEDDEDEKDQESESSIWSKRLEVKEEKSRDEEYEDYFADLLQ